MAHYSVVRILEAEGEPINNACSREFLNPPWHSLPSILCPDKTTFQRPDIDTDDLTTQLWRHLVTNALTKQTNHLLLWRSTEHVPLSPSLASTSPLRFGYFRWPCSGRKQQEGDLVYIKPQNKSINNRVTSGYCHVLSYSDRARPLEDESDCSTLQPGIIYSS